MSVVIKSISGRELFRSETANSVRDAVTEAVKAGVPLIGADLRGALLRSADLSGADLRGADLRGADLLGANLRGANLRGADLRYADLSGAVLHGSDLWNVVLWGANMQGAHLQGADLRRTICLSVTGMPSGHAILVPTPDGWYLAVGCWTGTTSALRDLISRDKGWPSATGDQVTIRRPMLAALADMCDAWAAANAQVLQEIQEKWNEKEVFA